jgi:hypothetical protein
MKAKGSFIHRWEADARQDKTNPSLGRWVRLYLASHPVPIGGYTLP